MATKKKKITPSVAEAEELTEAVQEFSEDMENLRTSDLTDIEEAKAVAQKPKAKKTKKAKTEPLEATPTEAETERPSDNRVKCCICGNTAPKANSIMVGKDEYVCSKRCLSRYGQTRREHAHR